MYTPQNKEQCKSSCFADEIQSKIEEPKLEEIVLLVKIEPEKFQSQETIDEELGQNLMALSVIELYTRGPVYVDDPEKPNISVIWNFCDSVLVGGMIEENSLIPLRDLFSKTLMVLARESGIPLLNFYSTPATFERLGNILITLNPRQVRRSPFQTQSLKDLKTESRNIDNTPRRITSEMLEMGLVNTQLLEGWIYSFWKDVDFFISNSGGYTVVRNGAILSWCIGMYRSADRIEADLETVEGSRNQGFGLAVARA